MTPAERLRAAAQLARETAEAAFAPWHPWSDVSLPQRSTEAEWRDDMRGYLGGEWGEQAALWSPPVALAVAAWLEEEEAVCDLAGGRCDSPAALAVADALLQTQPVKPMSDTRLEAALFNDISEAPTRHILFSDRLKLREYLWEQGWRRELRPDDVTLPVPLVQDTCGRCGGEPSFITKTGIAVHNGCPGWPGPSLGELSVEAMAKRGRRDV